MGKNMDLVISHTVEQVINNMPPQMLDLGIVIMTSLYETYGRSGKEALDIASSILQSHAFMCASQLDGELKSNHEVLNEFVGVEGKAQNAYEYMANFAEFLDGGLQCNCPACQIRRSAENDSIEDLEALIDRLKGGGNG